MSRRLIFLLPAAFEPAAGLIGWSLMEMRASSHS
jgi:hypothetical protein